MDAVPGPARTLSRRTLKLAALFFMLLNHIAWIFLPEDSLACGLLTGLGYFTAPVMCYLLAEGVFLTRSVLRYLFRLLLFALLSQVPYDLADKCKKVASGLVWRNQVPGLKVCIVLALLGCLRICQDIAGDTAKSVSVFLRCL